MGSNGALTPLQFFVSDTNGASPYGGLIEREGTFWGTTTYAGIPNAFPGNGTVFQVGANSALRTLVAFGGANGANPLSELVRAPDGNLYGTTWQGGTNNQPLGYGTVFRVTSNGVVTTLYSFSGGTNGYYPTTGLILGADGNFYGTTSGGGTYGAGTVFRITSDGVLATLASFGFTNGASPNKLVQIPSGDMYGTAQNGGIGYNGMSSSGYGTLFKLTTNGVLSTLVFFNGTNGAKPQSALTPAAYGRLYGTTQAGGTNFLNSSQLGHGTIFNVTPDGMLTSLFSFNGTNGAGPRAPLVPSTDGNFYGTTSYGGLGYNGVLSSGYGTVFRFSPRLQPTIQDVTRIGDVIHFSWHAAAGQRYQVQCCDDLVSPTWSDLGDVITAANDTAAGSDVVASNDQRFYRVVLLP